MIESKTKRLAEPSSYPALMQEVNDGAIALFVRRDTAMIVKPGKLMFQEIAVAHIDRTSQFQSWEVYSGEVVLQNRF